MVFDISVFEIQKFTCTSKQVHVTANNHQVFKIVFEQVLALKPLLIICLKTFIYTSFLNWQVLWWNNSWQHWRNNCPLYKHKMPYIITEVPQLGWGINLVPPWSGSQKRVCGVFVDTCQKQNAIEILCEEILSVIWVKFVVFLIYLFLDLAKHKRIFTVTKVILKLSHYKQKANLFLCSWNNLHHSSCNKFKSVNTILYHSV